MLPNRWLTVNTERRRSVELRGIHSYSIIAGAFVAILVLQAASLLQTASYLSAESIPAKAYSSMYSNAWCSARAS